MFKNAFFKILGAALFTGCTVTEPPESATDCARQFVEATYNGNFKKAGKLILPDAENRRLLHDSIETPFRSKTSHQKEALSLSSIQILKIRQTGDTLYLDYLNAYNNVPSTICCFPADGTWKTDLTKTFSR